MLCLFRYDDAKGNGERVLCFITPTGGGVWVDPKLLFDKGHSVDGVLIREPVVFKTADTASRFAVLSRNQSVLVEVNEVRNEKGVLIGIPPTKGGIVLTLAAREKPVLDMTETEKIALDTDAAAIAVEVKADAIAIDVVQP